MTALLPAATSSARIFAAMGSRGGSIPNTFDMTTLDASKFGGSRR